MKNGVKSLNVHNPVALIAALQYNKRMNIKTKLEKAIKKALDEYKREKEKADGEMLEDDMFDMHDIVQDAQHDWSDNNPL